MVVACPRCRIQDTKPRRFLRPGTTRKSIRRTVSWCRYLSACHQPQSKKQLVVAPHTPRATLSFSESLISSLDAPHRTRSPAQLRAQQSDPPSTSPVTACWSTKERRRVTSVFSSSIGPTVPPRFGPWQKTGCSPRRAGFPLKVGEATVTPTAARRKATSRHDGDQHPTNRQSTKYDFLAQVLSSASPYTQPQSSFAQLIWATDGCFASLDRRFLRGASTRLPSACWSGLRRVRSSDTESSRQKQLLQTNTTPSGRCLTWGSWSKVR